VEVDDSDNHYSLLKYAINYERKKFYDTGPGVVFTKNLNIGVF
jgi:hypothetical protein